MKKAFHDKFQMECTFMDEGIAFCNSKKNVYFPYGCMDSLNLSLLGVLQAVSHAQVCCFTVQKQDKGEIKELVKQAKAAMKTAPAADAVVIEMDKIHVDSSLPHEEQLRQYKAHFVQGMIAKEQYDFMKRMLTD